MSGLLCSIPVSVCLESRILNFLFCSNGSGWWGYYFSPHSISHFLCRCQWTFFPTLPWHFLYWFPAKWGEKQTVCVILSTFSLHSPVCIGNYIQFVNGMFYWVRCKSLFFWQQTANFLLFFLILLLLTTATSVPHSVLQFLLCRAFFQLSSLSFCCSLIFLSSLSFSYNSSLDVFTSFLSMFTAWSNRFDLSSWTWSLALIKSLPPSVLGIYSLSTFKQGPRPPFIKMIFEVCWSTLSNSSLFQLMIPAPYQTVATAHVFKALTILPLFKTDFKATPTCLK